MKPKYRLLKDLIDFNSDRILTGTIFEANGDGSFYVPQGQADFKISTPKITEEFPDFFEQVAHNDE